MVEKETDTIGKIILIVISFSVIALFILLFYIIINNIPSTAILKDSSDSDDNYLYLSPVTYPRKAISIQTAKIYNQTWLEFDGTNDYVFLPSTVNDSISLWYNSSTSNVWQHIVTVGTTNYTNNSQTNPSEYPLYYNGTGYVLGKTDGSNFWEGYIDEVRIYEGFLNSTDVNTLFTNGR